MEKEHYIPYLEIAREIGIQRGEVLLLTSDILKLALKARKEEKEFDTSRFIGSFIDILGEEGTLLIPAFNYDLGNDDSYSIRQTSPMTGSLAMAAFLDGKFIRTAHPLHSFLVWGKEVDKLVKLKNISSFGPDSPFAWLLERNARMVFAGTTLAEAMTFTHFVEETEQVWYRHYRNIRINYTGVDGSTNERSYKLFAKKLGWTMKMKKLEHILNAEILEKKIINGISFYSIFCRDAFQVVSKDIRENNATSIAGFSMKLYSRAILMSVLNRLKIFRTTYGKVRSAKRIH